MIGWSRSTTPAANLRGVGKLFMLRSMTYYKVSVRIYIMSVVLRAVCKFVTLAMDVFITVLVDGLTRLK